MMPQQEMFLHYFGGVNRTIYRLDHNKNGIRCRGQIRQVQFIKSSDI